MDQIPTHRSELAQQKGVVVNHLAKLNEYDFTEVHRHEYFEFFYFLRGGGAHHIDFQKFDIHDNSVHIVAPGQVHQMERALDSEGYVILFELPSVDPPEAIRTFLFEHMCLDAEELAPIYALSKESADAHKDRILRIFDLAAKDDQLSRLKLQSEIQLFCIACMEMKSVQPEGATSEYMAFRSLLKDNFKTLKKVKQYAELLHITERSLNDIVKRKTGKSTSEIIYGQLIMEAKRLLRTGITVKESAYELNFDDPAHFSKFFKAQTGVSPSDFQQNT